MEVCVRVSVLLSYFSVLSRIIIIKHDDVSLRTTSNVHSVFYDVDRLTLGGELINWSTLRIVFATCWSRITQLIRNINVNLLLQVKLVAYGHYSESEQLLGGTGLLKLTDL